jgi:hypothetical protein
MLKRTFKIVNLVPTFLTLPLKNSSVGLQSGKQAGPFDEAQYTPALTRLARNHKISIVWESVPVSPDFKKTGKVEIKKKVGKDDKSE